MVNTPFDKILYQIDGMGGIHVSQYGLFAGDDIKGCYGDEIYYDWNCRWFYALNGNSKNILIPRLKFWPDNCWQW